MPLVVTLLVVLLVGGGATAVFLLTRETADPVAETAAPEAVAEAGCQAVERQPDLGGGHLTASPEALAAAAPDDLYPDRPATSGPHLGQVAASGFYDATVDERLLVHNLEHGYVVVWYQPDTVDGDELRAWIEDEAAAARPKVIAAPASDDALLGDGAVVLTAWFQRQTCEAFDPDVATAFAADHHGTSGEAPERTIAPHEPGMPGVLAPDDVLLFPPLD